MKYSQWKTHNYLEVINYLVSAFRYAYATQPLFQEDYLFTFFSGIHEFLKANSLMQFNTLQAKVHCYFETMELLFAQNVKM